jgi:hypothetical protein
MPTDNPRANIVVEPPLYGLMHDLARAGGWGTIHVRAIARSDPRSA